MEEYKNFVSEQIKSSGKILLIGSIALPLISIAFLIWFASAGTTVVVPRIVAVAFVFGIPLGALLFFSYLRSRNPQNHGLYKMLFVENNLKSLKIKKVYGSFNFEFVSTKSIMPKTLTIRTKENAEKLLQYVRQYNPNAMIG